MENNPFDIIEWVDPDGDLCKCPRLFAYLVLVENRWYACVLHYKHRLGEYGDYSLSEREVDLEHFMKANPNIGWWRNRPLAT